MKSRESATKIEKAIAEIQMELLGTVKDYTPPLTFECYQLIKRTSEKHEINNIQIIKVIGHRDYGLEDKIESYESRLRLHQHGAFSAGNLH
jgi:hypothetical protein